ncbi:hypothetical protein Sjap_004862 [Stephania japonica]|uniref:FAD-binding FR-type domain-containing protein n=1 Tax=Stephania japonica TaxID=461633 RepID=A0AAP0K4C1_9MAGN
MENKVGLIAYIVGCLGNICLAFLFFPVTRGSSVLPLVGLTSESSIKYHIWLGHISMVFFTLHSVGFIIYYALVHDMAKLLEWSRNSISNVAGEIVFVFCLVMWATSIARVRIKMFELFFYTHQLYALYILFFVLHVGIAYSCLILPGIFLFLIDRYLRFLQSRHKAQLISAHILPCGVVELHVSKSPGLRYAPMSIMFINIPSISKLQWHPFTVTSDCNMETNKLSILIKCEGNWSRALYKTLSLHSPDQLCVSVEGPYGPTSLPFLRYDSLVMVSGGSGIAAFIPIIKDIVYNSTTQNYPIQEILIICSFKRTSDLSMLDLLLPTDTDNTPLDISNIKLKIQAYVTREEQELNDIDVTDKKFHTILFKQDPTIAPVTTILGRNSWLWLGAIISSSFTMFLLFLAILTRFYIYPIDQNTDKIYHFSGRALWNMFFICSCVAVTASFAFMWNKKQALEELKQSEGMNNDTPKQIKSLSNDSANKSERDLESLQHEQLIKNATMVHFGGRPNLEKILSNCEGSSVGVLVCGPREMRHEVAKLCSNGSTNNLHFEAISFNW